MPWNIASSKIHENHTRNFPRIFQKPRALQKPQVLFANLAHTFAIWPLSCAVLPTRTAAYWTDTSVIPSLSRSFHTVRCEYQILTELEFFWTVVVTTILLYPCINHARIHISNPCAFGLLEALQRLCPRCVPPQPAPML